MHTLLDWYMYEFIEKPFRSLMNPGIHRTSYEFIAKSIVSFSPLLKNLHIYELSDELIPSCVSQEIYWYVYWCIRRSFISLTNHLIRLQSELFLDESMNWQWFDSFTKRVIPWWIYELIDASNKQVCWFIGTSMNSLMNTCWQIYEFIHIVFELIDIAVNASST